MVSLPGRWAGAWIEAMANSLRKMSSRTKSYWGTASSRGYAGIDEDSSEPKRFGPRGYQPGDVPEGEEAGCHLRQPGHRRTLVPRESWFPVALVVYLGPSGVCCFRSRDAQEKARPSGALPDTVLRLQSLPLAPDRYPTRTGVHFSMPQYQRPFVSDLNQTSSRTSSHDPGHPSGPFEHGGSTVTRLGPHLHSKAFSIMGSSRK